MTVWIVQVYFWWALGVAICGCICASLAKRRNRSKLGWFLIGIVFGPVGVLAGFVAFPLEKPCRDIVKREDVLWGHGTPRKRS